MGVVLAILPVAGSSNFFSERMESKPTGGVHGSMRVPPQEDSTRPMGTLRLVWISRPKK